MFRRMLVTFVLGSSLIGAVASGMAQPVLMLMGGFLLLALIELFVQAERDNQAK